MVLAIQDVGLVQSVHLLQEDEGEDGVRAEAGVVWRETFPEREEAFRAHDLHQHLLMEQNRGRSAEQHVHKKFTILIKRSTNDNYDI